MMEAVDKMRGKAGSKIDTDPGARRRHARST